MTKTIRINENTLQKLDDETIELFNDFIDRVVWGKVFAGTDPDQYDLKSMQLNLVIKVNVENEN